MSASHQSHPADRKRIQKRSHQRKQKQHAFDRSKSLGPFPLTREGQRLAELFPNGWNWIYTPCVNSGEKPEWETVRKYPLAPVELWSLHQDDSCIIGIRPNKETQWGILDIDAGSQYHPRHNSAAFSKILSALEDIGIVRSLLCQSSDSGGIHIYIPLPELTSSFGLALALKLNLEAAGLKLRSGQLEIFPNVKRYLPQGQGYSLYNGVRLPFQPGSGFLALSADLTPLPWSLGDWLDAFDRASAQQDPERLKQAIADAEINYRIRGGERAPHSLASWQDRIANEKLGWSGTGESNEKFKLFACEARVFMGMDSLDAIAAYVEETAINTSGFFEHSNHVHDLKQRTKDVAAWAMKYYWPLGGPSHRTTGYNSQQKAPADFSYHRAKHEAAQHRIKEAIAHLQSKNELPELATARAKAIVHLAKISQHTLYKESNKHLWHPGYFPISAQQSKVQAEQGITQPLENLEENQHSRWLQPLKTKRITDFLFKVRFVIIDYWRNVLTALAPQGQSAVDGVVSSLGFQNRGEFEGGNLLVTRWAEVKAAQTELFQLKLARHKHKRAAQDDLERQRHQKGDGCRRNVRFEASPELFNQLELKIQQQFSTAESLKDASIFSGKDREVCIEPKSLSQRSPCQWEDQEFQTWYRLAIQFGLVDDFHWEGGQYWVSLGAQIWPYAEMVGMFTLGWLRSVFRARGLE